MPLTTAQKIAWNLALTLRTVILLVRTDEGFSAIVASDYDGDDQRIVREYSPFG